MKRFAKKKMLLGLVLCAGVLMQLGPCGSALFSGFLASIDFCSILGPDCTLGPISPCGNPNDQLDNLLLDCPGETLPPGTGGIGGNGGGGTGGGAGS